MDNRHFHRKFSFARRTVFYLIAAYFFVSAFAARAATLDIVPGVGAYRVGQSFSADVTVSSPDQPVNAVSGTVSFPSDKLEVVSLSKTGSIVNLWVQDPSFSNASGIVSFEGAILNPGFQGGSAPVVRVTFRAVAPGNATVGFSLASVLANDGNGTNVLQKTSPASFSLSQQVITPAPESETHLGKGTAPVVSSDTHPDPNQWYANSDPRFSWPVASDTIGIRIGYGAIASGAPTVSYTTPISSKQLQAIPDGTWYFHVQLKGASGWGDISHFKFNIDTQPPVITQLTVASQTDLFDPAAHVTVIARDAMSGIASYVFQADHEAPATVSADQVAGGAYAFGPQTPGTHTLTVRVYDKAGNVSEASTDFLIKPIDQPRIIEYSQTVQAPGAFTVKGTTYGQTTVQIWVKRESANTEARTYEAQADQSGSFFFATQDLTQPGTYSFWLVAHSQKGAQSMPTGTYSFTVSNPWFTQWGTHLLSGLSVAVPIMALIGALLGIVLWCARMYGRWKAQASARTKQSERVVHMAMLRMYKDVANHLRMLEKTQARRALTREEEYMLSYFKDRIKELERVIDSEIERAGSGNTNHHA